MRMRSHFLLRPTIFTIYSRYYSHTYRPQKGSLMNPPASECVKMLRTAISYERPHSQSPQSSYRAYSSSRAIRISSCVIRSLYVQEGTHRTHSIKGCSSGLFVTKDQSVYLACEGKRFNQYTACKFGQSLNLDAYYTLALVLISLDLL